MTTIPINKANAIKAFKEADAKGKALLQNLLGKDVLSEKIEDRIKTFEDACEALEVYPEDVLADLDAPDEEAYKKLKVITKALNEGWEPDWTNSEPKYQVWLTDYKAGVGFSASGYADWNSYAGVGSRLCFKSEELAIYAGKQFRDLYNQFFN